MVNSLDNAWQKENVRFRNARFSGIRNIIDRIQLILSDRTQKKELSQYEKVLTEITFTFLNRYEYKHGYVRPGILSDINLEVLNRLKNKTKSQMDDLKPDVTTKGLVYLLIYQSCVGLINSYYATHPSGNHPHSEALLDLIQFSLNGLNHEKVNGISCGKCLTAANQI